MRSLSGILAGALLAAACSQDPGSPSAADLAAPVDMKGGPVDLNGCVFQFGSVYCIQTSDSVRIPLRGGTADHSEVITIEARSTIQDLVAMTILYDTTAASCADAKFPDSVVLNSYFLEGAGRQYSGVIPAQRAGTHVCWRLAADTCGTKLFEPSSGAFDYTTF